MLNKLISLVDRYSTGDFKFIFDKLKALSEKETVSAMGTFICVDAVFKECPNYETRLNFQDLIELSKTFQGPNRPYVIERLMHIETNQNNTRTNNISEALVMVPDEAVPVVVPEPSVLVEPLWKRLMLRLRFL
jgi:hypothetical protein